MPEHAERRALRELVEAIDASKFIILGSFAASSAMSLEVVKLTPEVVSALQEARMQLRKSTEGLTEEEFNMIRDAVSSEAGAHSGGPDHDDWVNLFHRLDEGVITYEDDNQSAS